VTNGIAIKGGVRQSDSIYLRKQTELFFKHRLFIDHQLGDRDAEHFSQSRDAPWNCGGFPRKRVVGIGANSSGAKRVLEFYAPLLAGEDYQIM
jgi:hypothetical protein